MADEPTTVVGPKAEAQAAPMTAVEFLNELDTLIERGKAAGLNPLGLIARTGIRQGASWFDRVLAAVESNGTPVVKK